MIYLDYAANTPLDDRIKSQLHYWYSLSGNAQSKQMTQLNEIIAHSKNQIASYINGNSDSVYFTSGATESINLALLGSARYYQHSGNHIITFETEHSATLNACKQLELEGFQVSILPVKPNGAIDYQLLKEACNSNTILVSINHICNETGFIQDLKPLIELKNQLGFMLHIDCSQTVGKETFDARTTPADFITLSSHKCYGPSGIAALYIQPNRHVRPLIYGNDPIRPGTPSVGLIGMMGAAYEIAHQALKQDQAHAMHLREQFLSKIKIPYYIHTQDGVAEIINICFHTLSEQKIAHILSKIYCQQSASCHQQGLSHVLSARNIHPSDIKRSIRLSIGRVTTQAEIDQALHIINTLNS
ncbi:aminotransferase class V-fold PLP-dependent enzyme [Candidatus Comchoanobacter bicostacola]|uniref:Aminotransferase class V-fold PLP-dependent enzyme n=1 Tax=Candidatus Comchoanobacter bicostacola TaxID=2919598 RepID=A0ABY5DKD0_9GAMM|nr:aminotransferase class V-fold PLP-dependent enzyme [Candidatus Comchoanobacter bicostacola]UTC24252.1 aminotransferase class V-fold PLP-dependent enzyme [Candidatus Comchoanobacter bicostacola]